jgi:hypothetical protein
MGVSWLGLDMRSASIAAVALVVVAAAVRPARRRWSDFVAAGAVEAALVCVLFALWQLANSVAHHHVSGGLANGRWLWNAERWLHVPSETDLQALVLPHSSAVRVSNYYYATAHLTGMVVFLVWLWLRHREHYARWRTTMAIFTGLSLLVQVIPVAPPRLIGGTGLLDTGQAYGQSVYQTFDFADQYAAMPSIHVGWAVLISVAVVRSTTSRWRWVFAAYAPLTFFAVVATANHYWVDGFAAMLLLVVALAGAAALEPLRLRLQVPEPEPEPTQIQQGAFS